MKFRTGQIARFAVTSAMLFLACLPVAPVLADEASPQVTEGYTHDPILSGSGAAAAAPAGGAPMRIESNGSQANLHVDTPSPLSPYLGAEKKSDPGPADMPLRTGTRSDNLVDNYNLEAGVGVRVQDNTSLNLGYRFHKPPTLLDEPAAAKDDVRFSIDFKLPF